MEPNKKVLIVEDQFVEAHDLQLMLEKAGYNVCGIARSVTIALDMIKTERPDLVLLDIFLRGKLTGIDLANQLKEDNIVFIYLSANSNEEILSAAKKTDPYGFIVKPFREKDLLVTLEIAQYRHEHSHESKYRREAEVRDQLEKNIPDHSGWSQKLLQIGKIVQANFPFDFLAAGFDNPEQAAYTGTGFLRIGFDEYQTIGLNELLTITGVTMVELALKQVAMGEESKAQYFNRDAFEEITQKPTLRKLFKETFHMKSHLSLPVRLASGGTFTFCFYSRRPDAYSTENVMAFHRLQHSLTRNIEQMLVAQNASIAGNIRENDRVPLANDNSSVAPRGFEGIIGSSYLLLNVFDQIAQVAPFDTAVLILGESGTGKEKIAESIHALSPRSGKALVKVNCATLPASLIESELFGHEKGSFTGAIDKRIGRFEQANGGTIFLDEIGEMPIDLQVKLLRVLQEKEIEPIGGRSTVKINVRIITATNRNLEKEVAEGRFRLDLYYRLNVFPLVLPPLRERTEDIPALSEHFIKYYNRKAGKKITGLSDNVLKKMELYHWPGNIRELENSIERSILLTKGTVIDDVMLSVVPRKETPTDSQDFPIKTIHENERDYIISVLKHCKGKIWGTGGAAEILNIPPTTLKSKMKKLDIHKEY